MQAYEVLRCVTSNQGTMEALATNIKPFTRCYDKVYSMDLYGCIKATAEGLYNNI